MSASEFEGHEALVAQLRAGTLDAPDHLHRRVLALGARKRRPFAWASTPRRKLVLVLPVAATLAVGAAFVHGAFFSGNNNTFSAGPAVLAAGLASTPAHDSGSTIAKTSHRSAERMLKGGTQTTSAFQAYKTPTQANPTLQKATPPTEGLTGLNANDAAVAGVALGTSPNLYAPVTIPTDRLVHADASLQVIVPSHAALTKATNNATKIVTQLGGYAQNVQYQTSRKGDGNAYLDLRVPVGKAETAIGRLGALGRLVSQQLSTEDLQQTFTKQKSAIGQLKRAIAIYEQALNSGSVSGSQRVEVEIRLSNAEHALTAQRKQHSRTAAAGATADIQLQLTTNQHAFVGGPHKTGRLGRLLHNAGDFLALEGVIVLYALIVAGPIVLVVFVAWWLARERRRRDERRLLASA